MVPRLGSIRKLPLRAHRSRHTVNGNGGVDQRNDGDAGQPSTQCPRHDGLLADEKPENGAGLESEARDMAAVQA